MDSATTDTARTLVAVFASPVADHLLRYGRDLGYRTALVEPERGRVANDLQAETTVLPRLVGELAGDTDVVVTDHHRPELGLVLRDALALDVRWVGVMGSPNHAGPHVAALRDLGVGDEDIARVRRPIGLNIGSRTPAEIAISTLAGLVADRNGAPGGFEF
ncbi:XdhC family protein [Actinophytocola xanthii]|uniref:Xanthine dehydrogenase n=1 Tax=Actinophytocola xanthii TaxID=1912961 RepID=A0A1Q8CYL1_9PSEU|nr:XdhC family protein [Actinophytocola xanthii]OLF19443.1 xanthine dehydrogenase [Actinophytocola xanthii]